MSELRTDNQDQPALAAASLPGSSAWIEAGMPVLFVLLWSTGFVVAKLGQTEPDIPVLERMVSVGAAVQNLLLAAHSMGFGSSLTSGQAMKTSQMRNFLCLSPHEEAVCFVNIGTVVKRKAPRLRPDWREFVNTL